MSKALNLLLAIYFVASFTSTSLLVASVDAQQPPKLAKIGWLAAGPGRSASYERYKKALQAIGYTEGKNVTFDYRFPEDGKLDHLPALAQELARLKVDIIVAVSTGAAVAAKNASTTIPIVFTSGGDPVAVGLVDSLAWPGGNLTGFSSVSSELSGKRLELLKETVQKLTHVAVLRDPQAQSATQEWKESLHPARELGLQLHSIEVNSADKFESAFREAIKARSAALWLTSSAILISNQKRIADLALKTSPASTFSMAGVCRGGRLDVLRTRRERSLQARRLPHRQDIEGRQTRRSAGRATHWV